MLLIEPVLGFMRFAEEAEHSEEAKETINPILPVLPEIIWSAIFFFGLWALMKFVLLPPIVAGRDQRLARVSAGQDSVSDSEAELAQIMAAHNDRTAAAKAQAASIIDGARVEAEADRAKAVAAVEAEIVKLRSIAQSEIDTARSGALTGARGAVSSLAVGAASKVLGSTVDLASNQALIDSYLNGREN